MKNLAIISLIALTSVTLGEDRVFKSQYYPIIPSSLDSSSYANVDTVQLTDFALIAIVDFDGQTFSGLNYMTFKAIQDTSEIVLDYQGCTVDKVYYAAPGATMEYFAFTEKQEDPVLGNALRIYLTDKIYAGQTISVRVSFTTTNESLAINWLTKEQTSSQTKKYMYTKCEPIHCRGILPLQDTPSIKFTYQAAITVNNQYYVNMSANCTEEQSVEGSTNKIFRFHNQIQIPSYLFAIVVGNLKTVHIDYRTSVIAEPDVVDNYAKILAPLPQLLNETEKYVNIPYIWGQYNILVHPPSFPVGGMENPLLTFASPTVMVPDGSQLYVATHEIAHSWTGNMVTCRDWNNLWLNEGFTTFIERKVSAILYGEDFAKQENLIGNASLFSDMAGYGINNSYSALYPQVENKNPDNAASEVSYEKGNQFLIFLESKFDSPADFKEWLTAYISNYTFKSITFLEMRLSLINYIKTKYGDRAQAKLDEIDWVTWVQTPGAPPVTLDFSTVNGTKFQDMAVDYVKRKGDSSPDNYMDYVNTTDVLLKQLFHDKLSEYTKYLSSKLIKRLDADLNATLDENPEIGQRWFPTLIANKYQSAFPTMETYVSTIGRQKYIVPVYKALVKYGYRTTAYNWYKENEKFYHPIAAAKIRSIIKATQSEYPEDIAIMFDDLEEDDMGFVMDYDQFDDDEINEEELFKFLF